jgi:long-chain acyl-CoA synthetase
VENHYLKSPLIKEMCVLQSGGNLRAVVVPDASYARQNNIVNINDAVRWEINALSKGIPPHMRVMGYTLRHEPLPRTPLGKLRRFMVSDAAFGAGLQKEDDPALMSDEVGRVVVRLAKGLMSEPAGIRSPDSLELDLGLDSLKRLELAVSLEDAFGVRLPEEMFFELQSVGEVLDKIKDLRSAGGRGEERGGAGGEPAEEEKRDVGLERGPLQEAAARLGVGFARIIFRLLLRLDARGLDNLPEAPHIIAANHSSYLDGFAIAAAVPARAFRTLYFQGLRKYFGGRLMSRFARLFHVIALDPAYFDRAMRVSAFVLSRGNSLCIFPEGGRSFDGGLMDFKKGVGILAVKLDVPVVPARIEGTFHVLPRGAWRPRPGRVRVVFGRPLRASSLDMSRRPEGVDEFQFFADELRRRVAGLRAGQP